MELKIEQYTPATEIVFNYDELKAELQKKADMYASIVYTAETVKDAKADRANLKSLQKALNDERIRREREFMEPFNEFKSKINEIIRIIDTPVMTIDTQVKAFEEAEKEKKRLEVVALWDSLAKPDFITLDNVWSDRFLNKTTTLSQIQNDMETFINRVNMDLATLASIPADDVAMDNYKRTLNVASAIDESNRIKRIQEAAEKRKREEAERAAEEAARIAAETAQKAAEAQEQKTVEETVTEAPKDDSAPILAKWMRFEAFMTVEQAVVLRDFCKANGIALRRPQD